MRLISAVLLVPAVLFAASAFAQQPKKPPASKGKQIQCWTNKAGLRECGNVVPPEYAKNEREVFDSKGRTIATKARQKTPEEVAAEAAAAKKLADDKRAAEEQARYDKFLLDTYSKVTDLEKARDDRIAILDGQLRLADKAVADGEASMKTLNERAGKQRQDGKDVDKKLAKQLKDYAKGLADNKQAMASLKAKREEINTTFGKDIARYKLIAPPPPAVASAKKP